MHLNFVENSGAYLMVENLEGLEFELFAKPSVHNF